MIPQHLDHHGTPHRTPHRREPTRRRGRRVPQPLDQQLEHRSIPCIDVRPRALALDQDPNQHHRRRVFGPTQRLQPLDHLHVFEPPGRRLEGIVHPVSRRPDRAQDVQCDIETADHSTTTTNNHDGADQRPRGPVLHTTPQHRNPAHEIPVKPLANKSVDACCGVALRRDQAGDAAHVPPFRHGTSTVFPARPGATAPTTLPVPSRNIPNPPTPTAPAPPPQLPPPHPPTPLQPHAPSTPAPNPPIFATRPTHRLTHPPDRPSLRRHTT